MQNTRFLSVLLYTLGRAVYMHTNLTARITAQHRPILNKRGFCAVTRRRQRRTKAIHTAANDDDFIFRTGGFLSY